MRDEATYVIYFASSDARNAAMLATSSGSHRRPSGSVANRLAFPSALSSPPTTRNALCKSISTQRFRASCGVPARQTYIGVSPNEGLMMLKRMRCLAYAPASPSVACDYAQPRTRN